MLYQQFSDLSHSQKLRRLRQIARQALVHFPIHPARLRFYGEHSNALFTVDAADGSRYLLKIARPGDHTPEEIRSALLWLHQANRAGVDNLMEVVPTEDGRLVVTVRIESIPEPRYCSLYQWIPGRNLQGRITRRTAWKWGELSARLHEFSVSSGSPPGMEVTTWDRVFYWDEEVLFSDDHSNVLTASMRDVFHRTTEAVQAHMDRLYSNGSKPILVHGDLHPDNIRVSHGTLHAIDFEDVMWAFPLQDIAISLLYVRRRDDFSDLIEAFRHGYSTVRMWPVADIRELDTYFVARLLMFANFIVKLTDFDADTVQTLERYAQSCRRFLDA